MKRMMKIDAWIAAIIGIVLLAVGIIVFLIEADISTMTWDDWYHASIPFILWAICMRLFAATHEEKTKE